MGGTIICPIFQHFKKFSHFEANSCFHFKVLLFKFYHKKYGKKSNISNFAKFHSENVQKMYGIDAEFNSTSIPHSFRKF